MRLWAAALALGCAPVTSESAADRAAYLSAANAENADCGAISDPRLAGECWTFAAHARAASDLSAARALCARIPPGLWHDECFFLACDTAEVGVAAAKMCCADAGRYARRCTGHAVSRAVYEVLAGFPPGEEAAALAQARRVSTDALGSAGRARADDLFVRFIVDRTEGAHLRAADCGSAPETMCADAYAELTAKVAADRQVHPPSFVRSACARVVTVERATGLGLPGWDPELDSAVQAAFQRMCAR